MSRLEYIHIRVLLHAQQERMGASQLHVVIQVLIVIRWLQFQRVMWAQALLLLLHRVQIAGFVKYIS